MPMPKSDPLRDLIAIQRQINKLFEDRLATGSPSVPSVASADGASWSPPVDLYETDDAFVLVADLPGLTKEEVVVKVERNRLTIRGERKKPAASGVPAGNGGDAFLRVEQEVGSFARSFHLPGRVDAKGIGTDYRDGIFQVKVPKILSK